MMPWQTYKHSVHGSRWNSLPLRVVLSRRTEVTPTLPGNYLGADKLEFRRAAS